MFHDFSSFFQRTKDPAFINLNNGTLGLCPDLVIEHQQKELEIYERNTTRSLVHTWPRVMQIQHRLADFLNTTRDDIFLRPNVTLVMNELIMGLELPPSSEILTTSFEYGAIVNILKYKASREFLKLRVMPMAFALENPSDEDWVQAVANELQPSTKLFVISHIFTGNGLVVPIDKINAMLREKGVLMVVDGAHAPGLIDLSFSKLPNVDYYGGNLHKWVMGPKGTAFGWVNPRLQEQTYPLYGSWSTDPQAATSKAYGDISPFAARMLWSHSQSFSAYFSLESCLEFWEKNKKETLRGEIKKRMHYLEDGLAKKGFTPLVSLKNNAAFIAYPLNGFSDLSFQENVILAGETKVQVGLPRLPGAPLLRLTPHIHNTPAEMDAALQILNPV